MLNESITTRASGIPPGALAKLAGETGGNRRQPVGDSVFAGFAKAAAFTILIALAGVAIFLTVKGMPAFSATESDLDGQSSLLIYVAKLAYGTTLAALLALLIATPLALAVALAVSHYAPGRLASPIGYAIDLLAAIPSVIFGLWGAFTLGKYLTPLYEWLAASSLTNWLPLFHGPASGSGRTILSSAVVLAIMILPIITAISREIFSQTPRLHQEAALALGATRWEMVRLVVFPHARSGIVSAAMLGLGRAMGETMAVAMVLSTQGGLFSLNLISADNPSTIAANIALRFPEAFGTKVNVLIFSGLALFAISFAVNFLARLILTRAGERRAS